MFFMRKKRLRIIVIKKRCTVLFILQSNITSILVKTFGTLCVSELENVIQLSPTSPLDRVGCYKSNLHTLRTSTLLRGSRGRGGGKSCQGPVYDCVLPDSCKFHRKHLKKRRCPKIFRPGLLFRQENSF